MKISKKLLALLIIAMLLVTSACSTNQGSPENTNTTETNTENTASSGGEYAEKDAEYVIKFANSIKQSEIDSVNPSGIGMKEFKKYVEDATNGKVIVKFFLGGQLATTNEDRVNGLQNGAFEMEGLNCGSWSEYTDAFLPLSAPYLFLNNEIANKMMDGPFGDRMNAKLLEDTGVRNLGYINIGFRQLSNSVKSVHTPDDVNGLKIRTMSDPYQIATWQELGAAVTPTAYSELYTALQQKMVDGQENPLSNFYTSGMYEIQPYLTLTNHAASFTNILINDQYFQSLPKEYQDILVEGAKVAVEKSREGLEEAEKMMIEEVSINTEVVELSIEEWNAFRDATVDVRDITLKNAIGEDYYNEIMEQLETVEAEVGL